MTPPHTHDHRAAFALQRAVVAVLAALALWALIALALGLYDAVAMRTAWPSVQGVYAGIGGEGQVEVELPADEAARLPALPQPQHPSMYQEGHVRVLLPDRPYAAWDLASPVTVAVRPGPPSQVVAVSALADAAMALAQAVWALVLGALARQAHRRLDWGRDATWDGAGWSGALLTAWPPGAQALEGQVLRDARILQRWAVLLTALFGALLVGNVVALVTGGLQASPIEFGFSSLALTLVVAVGLYKVVVSRTRRVQWDDAGVAETNWFRTRRVPWRAIARWQRVNTAAEAQARYDRQPSSSRKGSRPASQWAWAAGAAGGERLLLVEETMQPPDAQAALRQRVERVVRSDQWLGAAGAAETAAAGPDDDGDEPSAEARAQWQRHQAEFEAMQAKVARSLRRGYVLLLAPFLLMFLWPTWHAIDYQFFAERVQGTVVATEQDTEVPQLTVRYPGPDGRSLELRTDGMRANQGIAVGSHITVLRPRADPEDAKVAMFWAVWIWPVITGVLLVIVAVPFYVGFIHMPRRAARERAAHNGTG